MKIITWNCCLPPWSLSRKRRLPKILSTIVGINPDIVCLQEVFFRNDADFLKNNLGKNGFTDFFHFKDLFIASKIKLINKSGNTYKHQGKLFSLAFLDVLYKKGFQIVEFPDTAIVNTHLLSALASEKEIHQEVREKQVQEICKTINDYDKRMIIAGDFNFKPNSLPYKFFLESGFKDIINNIEENTTKTSRLDYFFMKSNDRYTLEIVPLDSEISDHAILILNDHDREL
ncbi:MAG: endonuclease/exonuclease/phosphatase family protein [Candidatus Paceibacterota bacterium]|jgi:endonuclease/exonuclease/phosphatase family metal-dependent hydrolase